MDVIFPTCEWLERRRRRPPESGWIQDMRQNEHYRPFPVLTLDGDAYECGVQHGTDAADRVAKTIEIYLSAFEAETGLGLEAVRERARKYATHIEALDSDIMTEIRGIAEGARQNVEDIIAVNCRTELLFGSRAGNEPVSECTTLVALPDATRDGRILIGKNWDWRERCIDSVVVLRIKQRDKPRLCMIVEAGMVGRDGCNEDGIVVCGNLLTSNEDTGKTGVPIPILRRRILHARNYYSAIDTLLRAERGASGNYVIAHRDGVAIDFETTPAHAYPIYPERGLLTHANHFQSQVAQITGVAKYYTADSLYRDFRARHLLEPLIGEITAEDMKAVLRDQFGAPRAICRSPHDYPGHAATMTIASMVFDPAAGIMEVAAGQPTHSSYQRVALPSMRERRFERLVGSAQ